MPGDHDLYLAGFADDNHECLRLLLFHAADVAQLSRMALAAQISINDAEGVHLLLGAGADPNRYADDADPPSPVVYAAIRSRCSIELTGLLLGHGADPDAPVPTVARPTPWSPPRAARPGHAATPALCRRHHDRCRPAAGRLPGRGPGQGRAAAGRDPGAARPRPGRAAGRGDDPRQKTTTPRPSHCCSTAASPSTRAATTAAPPCTPPPTPAAPPPSACCSTASTSIEARDSTWDSTPVEWAAIGSGEQPASHPHPDWTEPCKPCSTRAPQPGTSPWPKSLQATQPRSRRSPAPPRRPVTSVLRPHPEPATPTVLPLSGPHAGTC